MANHADRGPIAASPVHVSAVVFVCVLNAVLTGWTYGAVALFPGLVRAGTFRGVCDDAFRSAHPVDSMATCHPQAVLLSQLFQFAACFNGVFSWPIGVVADVLGAPTLIRGFIVAGGAFFAIIGVWPEYGVSAKVGLLGFSVCAGGVMLLSVSAIVPAATGGHPDALDKWLLRAMACSFAGIAVGYPLGVFTAWPAIPFGWSCFIVAALCTVVFKVWYERSVSELFDSSPRKTATLTFKVRGIEFFKERRLILTATTYAFAQTLATSFMAASPRLMPHFDLDDTSAPFVPLMSGIGAGCIMATMPVLDSVVPLPAHRTVHFALRSAGLVIAATLTCVHGLLTPGVFWVIVFLLGFWSTSTFIGAVQLCAGDVVAGDPVRMGAMLTLANAITFVLGQPLTYGIAESEWWMRVLVVAMAVACLCAEVPLLLLANQQYEDVRSTLRAPLAAASEPGDSQEEQDSAAITSGGYASA